jgi:alkylation response protein AidB-like acyl-CoA dehydrogenase
MHYQAPIKDQLFVMRHLAGIDALAALPGFEDAGSETAQAVLEECARYAQDVAAPLNRDGDRQPARLVDGRVTTTPGWSAAFRQYVDGGWQGLPHPPAVGGQGLPKLLHAACIEMVNSANLSFALCPLLTDGAIEALLTAGSPQQQATCIPPLIDGRWTGTMNLTEPQAGSDLAAVRTRAEPQADGSYRLFGTKIFITYGDHDLADNILHLVLARIAGAPEGVKGLSLFLCPKWRFGPDGARGERNDVQCVSLEHKLGIQASPTAVLQYGDQGGAWAERIGEPGRGLEYMFIMMNAARYAVGVQGIALAERAYQQAVRYARDRVQGRPVDGSVRHGVPIIRHPDVQRLLLTMRAQTESHRAMAFVAAAAHDQAVAHPEAAVRAGAQARYELLVPILKGSATEMSQWVASQAVQVHGGMGFIEETGVAQHYRDAKILSIYEGTTAIQANDLIGRKMVRDGGAAALSLADDVRLTEQALAGRADSADAQAVLRPLRTAREAWQQAVAHVLAQAAGAPAAVHAGSVPCLLLGGLLVGGWQMARALLAAEDRLAAGEDPTFMRAKIATARCHADQLLSQAPALLTAIVDGPAAIAAMPEDAY